MSTNIIEDIEKAREFGRYFSDKVRRSSFSKIKLNESSGDDALLLEINSNISSIEEMLLFHKRFIYEAQKANYIRLPKQLIDDLKESLKIIYVESAEDGLKIIESYLKDQKCPTAEIIKIISRINDAFKELKNNEAYKRVRRNKYDKSITKEDKVSLAEITADLNEINKKKKILLDFQKGLKSIITKKKKSVKNYEKISELYKALELYYNERYLLTIDFFDNKNGIIALPE